MRGVQEKGFRLKTNKKRSKLVEMEKEVVGNPPLNMASL